MSKRDNHHTVPSMYLKGFTQENRSRGTLWQLELLERTIRWQKKSPESVGRIFRFYETPNTSINGDSKVVESKLGEHFENMWSRTLTKVLDSNSLPSDRSEYEIFLQFVAFSAIRTARFKETVEAFRKHLQLSPESFALIRQIYLSNPDSQFHEMYLPAFENLLLSNSPLSQDEFVKFLVLYSPVNYWIFGQRSWELRRITAESPFLICSDDPVVVLGKNCTYLEPFDVLDSDSKVFIPLSRTQILGTVSTSPEQAQEISPDEVAKLNGYQMNKSKQLFMCEPKFYAECHEQRLWFER